MNKVNEVIDKINSIREAHQPAFNKNTVVAKDAASGKPDIEELKTFSAGYHPDKKIGWIEAIKVDSEHERKGIASKAVDHYEKFVKSQGGKEMRGEALPISLPFWKKKGYTIKKINNKNRYPIVKNL